MKYLLNRTFALLLLVFPASLLAQPSHPLRQEVGGLVFAYGVVPAEVVLSHPEQHSELKMHGGAEPRQSHIFLALFDAKEGTRIANADASVHVTLAGGAGETRRMEPMAIAGQPGFGAFVSLGTPGIYVIRFDVRLPGAPMAVSARFDHRVSRTARR